MKSVSFFPDLVTFFPKILLLLFYFIFLVQITVLFRNFFFKFCFFLFTFFHIPFLFACLNISKFRFCSVTFFANSLFSV